MKHVLYTLTEGGILLPAGEAATQAEVQQAYDVGFAFGEITGQRKMLSEIERVVAERAGSFETTADDIAVARRGMLH